LRAQAAWNLCASFADRLDINITMEIGTSEQQVDGEQ